jgi:hypothetical protein
MCINDAVSKLSEELKTASFLQTFPSNFTAEARKKKMGDDTI